MYLYLADALLPRFKKPGSHLLSGLLVDPCFDLADLDLSSNCMHVHHALVS